MNNSIRIENSFISYHFVSHRHKTKNDPLQILNLIYPPTKKKREIHISSWQIKNPLNLHEKLHYYSTAVVCKYSMRGEQLHPRGYRIPYSL